jgi:membrane protein CcdC involved in cytochrome C biogenesis
MNFLNDTHDSLFNISSSSWKIKSQQITISADLRMFHFLFSSLIIHIQSVASGSKIAESAYQRSMSGMIYILINQLILKCSSVFRNLCHDICHQNLQDQAQWTSSHPNDHQLQLSKFWHLNIFHSIELFPPEQR